MKKLIIYFMILVAVICTLNGCIKPENNQNVDSPNSYVPVTNSFVTIQGYYDEPETLSDKNTIVLQGLSEGEFVEITINGEIKDFEHVSLEWNDEKNDVIEKEIINKLESIKNRTIIIKTYMPEGIPLEKIKWKSISGKTYEYIIHENGIGGETDEDLVEKFNLE